MLIDTASAVNRIAKEMFQGKPLYVARLDASEMLLALVNGHGLTLHAREGRVSNYTNTLDNISTEKLAKIMGARAADEYEVARDPNGGDNNLVVADFEAAYADPDGKASVVLFEWSGDEEVPATFPLIDLTDEYDFTAGTLATHPANSKQMEGAPYHWRGLCVAVRLWGLSVDDMDLDLALAKAAAAAAPDAPAMAPKNLGGAPRRHDWDLAMAHMVAVASRDPDGLDGWSQGRIAREMADFLASLSVDPPTEDQAKHYARPIHKALHAKAEGG
ncbi:hypothetical protein [Xanthobacter sediminis]